LTAVAVPGWLRSVRPVAILLALTLPLLTWAAIDARGLVFEARQEQALVSSLNARLSDGRRDRSKDKVSIVHVSLRAMGPGIDEPAELRWFFLTRSAIDNRLDYYSRGDRLISVPRRDKAVFSIVSDVLIQPKGARPELIVSKYIDPDEEPRGWIMQLYQNGKLVRAIASDNALLTWMERNPPPVAR
jgi:hypothetical protein